MRESLRPQLNNFKTIFGQIKKFGNANFDSDDRTIIVNPKNLLIKPVYVYTTDEPIPHDQITTLLINVTLDGLPIESGHMWFPIDFRKHGCTIGDTVMVTGRVEMYQYGGNFPIVKTTTPYDFKIEGYRIIKINN